MPQYMLLLYDDPSHWAKKSPEEMQKAVERYMAWSKKPFNTGGKRLADDPGKVMRGAPGSTRVSDGPFVESKEVLGGFYMIEAANYDEAVERTRDHPHLDFGIVEIRQVWAS